MKKIVSIFLVFMMILCVAGCGNKEENKENNGNQNQTENNNGDNESGKITLEDVMKAPESPESDFRCYDMSDGTVTIVNYLGDDEIVVIPETWKGKKITKISSYVFANDSPVKAIRLSDSIKEVMDSAFALNKSLEIFVSGSGMENIGIGAFQECTNLHTAVLNDGLKIIEGASFGGCKNLLELEIPESVIEIQPMTFYNGPENLVIIGKTGSTAEEFANKEGIEFRAK